MSYTVKDICERLGVGEHTVFAWIRNEELEAIDVSRNRGGKPRWRITEEALAAFELSRTQTRPPSRGRNRRQSDTDVIEFYK